jgi:hypothetical protein
MILGKLWIRLDPEVRRRAAMISLDIAVLGWIVSAFLPSLFLAITLHLSWAAFLISMLDVLTTTDVREEGAGD